MTRCWKRLVLIGIALSTLTVTTGVSSDRAWAASPFDDILSALTTLQNSITGLQSGAISDLQTQITALRNAVSALQDDVTALQTELVGPGRSNVRVSSPVSVAPDENAGCEIVNVSSVPLQVHSELIDFSGKVLSELTAVYQPGQSQGAVGLNQPGGDSQIPIHCRFTVLTGGHSRSDIRGQAVHVQRSIAVPAE